MKFGVGLPTCRQGLDVPPGFCGPEGIVEVAQLADNLGLDFVWGSDFATPIPALRQQFGQENINWFEILTSLAYCAAVTERVALGFGVIVLPFRDPVMLAKQISTLDVFSKGRVMFGVGIGGFREELEMLYPERANGNRAKMLEEGVQVMRMLFSQPAATFHGQYYRFDDVSFYPKPVQDPFPIYITGEPLEIAERVARYGDGWVPVRPSPAELKRKVARLKEEAEKVNRDISEFHVFAEGVLSVAATHDAAVKNFENTLVGDRFAKSIGKSAEEVLEEHYIGTPQEIAKKVQIRASAGATHIVPQSIAARNLEGMKEQIRMFAEDVIPLCS